MSGERDVLLVPDLALERWPSMDRYAEALARRLPETRTPAEAGTLRGPRYFARYLSYPRVLKRYRPAAVHIADHSYAHCLGAFPRVPSAVTVHDLYPAHVLSERGRTPRALVRDMLLRRALGWIGRADLVISATRFVAEEAATLLGIGSDRLRVAGYGVDDAFFARPSEAVVATRRSVWAAAAHAGRSPTFVLHVGSCAPRKNIEGVIAATAELRQRGTDVVLVQIGGRFTPAQRTQIGRAGLAGAVVQEPVADDAALIAAYHAADLLLFPSHYEGFGLPALEALAAGLPVVTSGVGGLAEAVGDAAVVVNPPEPARLADAIQRLLDSREERASLAVKGKEHARQHSWDASARAHRLVYHELLERR